MDNNKSEIEDANISANVDEDGARKIAETEYGLIATKIVRVNGYDDLNFLLPPPVCMNFWHVYLLTTSYEFAAWVFPIIFKTYFFL